MTGRRPRSVARALAPAVATSLLLAGLAGCSTEALGDDRAAGPAPSPTKTEEPRVAVTTNVGAHGVPVNRMLVVTAAGGTLEQVQVVGEKVGPLPGRLGPDGTTWTAQGRLEPGTGYTVTTVATNADGTEQRDVRRFRTMDLTLDDQTFASIAPLDGETVGVGMPVIVKFDVPVTDKASIEKHMKVTSTPAQQGAWHWLGDHEAHWRPATYWQPGSDVRVAVDINSVPAGNGVYGQESRSIGFHVGDSVVHKIDVAAHVMRTSINGALVRTTPISAGKEGFETRSGTKVIIEKHRRKRMDAATTGIEPGDPEYYNIEDVEYALRVTFSGEFLHAAPWSAGSQGEDNVSHGCIGMSTADARWVYEHSRRGDVVEVTGTDRQMTLENGFGDWNLPFDQYAAGSALS